MLYRMATLVILLVCTWFALVAQVAANGGQNNTGTSQPACNGGECTANSSNPAAPSFPSDPVHGKWEMEEFKASDASVSCAVVKFDSSLEVPILHLLCPGPNVFAPLRVHLMLTWKSEMEIPADIRSMLVDTASPVKFKSKLGDSQAELTFHDAQATNSKKEWITFTDVNVGLVLPPKH